MNYYDIFTLTQQAEIENPTLFPFPFNMHLIFACLATVFFVYRFATQKLPYQLIMAIAIPASLLIWVSESRTLFYTVGIIELVLILAALVTSFIFKPKEIVDDDEEDDDDEAVAESVPDTEGKA